MTGTLCDSIQNQLQHQKRGRSGVDGRDPRANRGPPPPSQSPGFRAQRPAWGRIGGWSRLKSRACVGRGAWLGDCMNAGNSRVLLGLGNLTRIWLIRVRMSRLRLSS